MCRSRLAAIAALRKVCLEYDLFEFYEVFNGVSLKVFPNCWQDKCYECDLGLIWETYH